MARAELRTRSTIDNSQFRRGVSEMRGEVQAFASGQLKSIGGMIGGAFAVGALVNFTRRQLEMADGLDDLSHNLNISTEAVQALHVSAMQFGGTAEEVIKSLQMLKRAQGDTLVGNKEYTDAWKTLKISMSDLARMNTAQLLETVARGYRDAGGSAQAYNAAVEVLGRSGKEVIGVLRDVADNGLQGLIDKGKEAGTVLEEGLVRQLADANNQLEILARRGGNALTIAGARAGGFISDVAAFWGAVSTVGISEARRQVMAGELGIDAESREAAKKRDADKAASDAAEQEARRQQRAAFLQAEIDKLTGKLKTPDLDNITVGAIKAADARAAIGGFTGGQTNPMASAAERQIKILELIAKTNEQNAKTQAEIEDLTRQQTELLKE